MISKILLVDDNSDNLDLLEDLLEDEFNSEEYQYNIEFHQALNGQQVLEFVEQEYDIDLILLDVMMPDMNGFILCTHLKANPLTKNIPIIFVSSKSDSVDILKGFELGASDYIVKPFKEEELIARVKKELKIQSLIKSLEFLASHDTMTGIYNRRKFFELAEEKFKQSDKDLYALMLDIDKFKLINDNYGHHIGDKVIINITDLISKLLSKDIIFGRLGGEEFAIIHNSSSDIEISELSESIRKNIENLNIKVDNQLSINVTMSIGICKINKYTTNLDELLKCADLALYDAKKTGRNRICYTDEVNFTKTMGERYEI